jgi:hypothetical protein
METRHMRWSPDLFSTDYGMRSCVRCVDLKVEGSQSRYHGGDDDEGLGPV